MKRNAVLFLAILAAMAGHSAVLAAAGAGSAVEVTATIPVGGRPGALCYNSRDDKVYCLMSDTNLVRVIAGATDSVIATVRVGKGACALCYNPRNNKVYCANSAANTISVIDGATNAITRAIKVRAPGMLCYNSRNNYLYCCGKDWFEHDVITVIDGASDKGIAGNRDSLKLGISDLCYDAQDNRLFAAARTANCVKIYDGDLRTYLAEALAAIATIPVGEPEHLCYNPKENEVLCAPGFYCNSLRTSLAGDYRKLVAIPGAEAYSSRRTFAAFSVDNVPVRLDCDPRSGKVYCATAGDTLLVIRGSWHGIDARIPLAGVPSGICFDTVGLRVYCSCWGSRQLDQNAGPGSVSVIDGGSNQVIATIPVGKTPGLLCFDSQDRKVFCANLDDRSISVIGAPRTPPPVVAIPPPPAKAEEQSPSAPAQGLIWLGTDLSDCGLIYSVVRDPSGQTVYIASEKRGVLKSTNGGLDWYDANTGLAGRKRKILPDGDWVEIDTGGAGLCVYCLVMARGNPRVLFAGTQNKGVFKTSDGGLKWTQVNSGLPQLSPGVSPSVWCLALAPNDDNLVYAGTGGGLFRSPDAAQNWFLVPGLPSGVVRSFGFGPGNGRRMYAGFDWGGFYYSDGGVGWRVLMDSTGFRQYQPGYRGLSYFVFEPSNPDIIYLIFGPGGIYKSTNGGVSWDFFSDGFPTDISGGGRFCLVWIAIDPNNPLILYGAGNDGRVYISRSGGRTWTDYSYGLGNVVPGSIGTIGFDSQGQPWIGGNGRLVEQGKITERRTLSATVTFGFDSSDVKPIAFPTLDSIVATLTAEPALRAVIEGHTDSVGTESYNRDLSQRRAYSVVSYFVGKGIASSRLTATGYGESMPIASNSTDDGRQRNRRVEILIVARK
jgi:YVTN family beta-propeller protein